MSEAAADVGLKHPHPIAVVSAGFAMLETPKRNPGVRKKTVFGRGRDHLASKGTTSQACSNSARQPLIPQRLPRPREGARRGRQGFLLGCSHDHGHLPCNLAKSIS